MEAESGYAPAAMVKKQPIKVMPPAPPVTSNPSKRGSNVKTVFTADDYISIAEWARRQGISKVGAAARVKRLMKIGLIKRYDGKISEKQVNDLWEGNRNERCQNNNPTGMNAAELLEAKRVDGDETPKLTPDSIDKMGLPQLQTERERLRVAKEQLLLRKLEGTLIDAAEVASQVEGRFREDAQALLDWPSRVSSTIAAELGLDDRLVFTTLDRHIRQFMKERSMHGVEKGKEAAA